MSYEPVDSSELTVSPDGLNQTGQTDETYFPADNAAFLRAVFVGLEAPARPFVLGFAGPPKARKAWRGEAWRDQHTNADDRALNWYFSLAVFGPDGDGYSRQEKHCGAVFGVMLDDLGTKALPLDRLTGCPPTYVIETSPGNYQAGYLFDKPETDLVRVKALNQSMVEAGLCDPGAKSPPTRYGRLPFASNGKTEPAFVCQLTEWHPSRRYSIDAITEGLELQPMATGRAKTRSRRSADTIHRQAEADVYTPRAAENAVLVALRERNLYKRPLGSGRHDITCPWVHEHTDRIDHGTAYFEPSDLYPVGGFKCQHAHGEHKKIGALLEHLAVTFTQAKHRPTIKVAAGELHRVVDAAEYELAASGRYHQRGGLIVAVQTDPGTNETVIKATSANALMRALSATAIWERFDARTNDFVVTDPPTRHVNILFDAEAYAHLSVLNGIARQPYLRDDDSLMTTAGYDAASGMFGVFDARAFDVPRNPSRADAMRALQQLDELLDEFSFAHSHDRAAALAGMLTAAVRASLPQAPMIHIRAPQIASGKSYLSALIAAFAGPSRPAAYSFPSNEEECAKLLLSALLEAPAVLTFDNLTGDLIPYKSLCSALTEPHMTGRILGYSKTATVGTRTLFLSSGNNVGPIRDMTRRTLTITLDPKCETPAARQFKADPVATVLADRGRYVSRALTVVRAYLAASAPQQEGLKPLGGFGDWTRMVRAPLMWLGQPDPATAIYTGMATDPDRETLARLLTTWHAAFGDKSTMIRDAVTRASTHDAADLREAIAEVAEERGEINRRRLGKWIARHQGRIVDGQRFESAGSNTSAVQWSVKSVSSVSSVSPVSFAGNAGSVSAHKTATAEPTLARARVEV